MYNLYCINCYLFVKFSIVCVYFKVTEIDISRVQSKLCNARMRDFHKPLTPDNATCLGYLYLMCPDFYLNKNGRYPLERHISFVLYNVCHYRCKIQQLCIIICKRIYFLFITCLFFPPKESPIQQCNNWIDRLPRTLKFAKI